MPVPSPLDVISVPNMVGKEIFWDWSYARDGWRDIANRRLHEHAWAGGVFPTPQRVCSFGRVRGRESLITAFGTDIPLYGVPIKRLDWMYRPVRAAGTRFNEVSRLLAVSPGDPATTCDARLNEPSIGTLLGRPWILPLGEAPRHGVNSLVIREVNTLANFYAFDRPTSHAARDGTCSVLIGPSRTSQAEPSSEECRA